MSAPQWKPGDVAMVDSTGTPVLCMWTGDDCQPAAAGNGTHPREPHWHTNAARYLTTTLHDGSDRSARPLVVIDPEDGEAVTRLTREVYKAAPLQGSPELYDAMQAALRSLIAPARPPVYSHLRSSVSPDGISVALCGKVWRAGADVLVVAECPNCRDLAEEWVA